MVQRVVSTKLTEDEHNRLVDICNKEGCTPSALIRKAIKEKIETQSSREPKVKSLSEISTLEELSEFLKEDARSGSD